MALYLSPIANDQQMDANGDPLVGGKIYTYLAGSTTPVATYTDSTGATAQANPIILNSLGLSASPIWLTGGVSYKFVIKDSADVTLRTIDGITGINDVSSTAQEWNESGLVPTYISATQFSVPGDQTALLQVNRRLRCDVTAGFAYGRISVSSFSSGITTITMVNDSTPLDSGLSSIAYGFLSFSPSSVPYALYASAGYNVDITGSPAFRNFISGLTLSTAGSSATMSIAAGVAMDSTNTYLMQLSSAISKTTSAWAVGSGNGGLDAGTIKSSALGATCSYATSVMTCTVAPTSGTFQVGQSIVADGIPANTVISSLGTGTGGTGTYNLSTSPGTRAARNTRGLFWYYPYLIRRPDTGIVDGLFSLSVSSPALPTNYTQFRRLGGMHTDGSALWPSFIQDGDHFQLVASNLDVGGLNPGTSAVSATLSVPMGINVDADINVLLSDSTNLGSGAYISDLATPDLAPSATAAPLLSTPQIATTNIAVAANLRVRTNTSAQIRYRCNVSFASLAFRIATLGRYDSRGKNS